METENERKANDFQTELKMKTKKEKDLFNVKSFKVAKRLTSMVVKETDREDSLSSANSPFRTPRSKSKQSDMSPTFFTTQQPIKLIPIKNNCNIFYCLNIMNKIRPFIYK